MQKNIINRELMLGEMIAKIQGLEEDDKVFVAHVFGLASLIIEMSLVQLLIPLVVKENVASLKQSTSPIL